MTECPFCKSKINKEAAKCPNCGEWVKALESESQTTDVKSQSVSSQSIKKSSFKIGPLEAVILILVLLIIISFIAGKLH
jgi:uncharacterized membrane protein YvbJ